MHSLGKKLRRVGKWDEILPLDILHAIFERLHACFTYLHIRPKTSTLKRYFGYFLI